MLMVMSRVCRYGVDADEIGAVVIVSVSADVGVDVASVVVSGPYDVADADGYVEDVVAIASVAASTVM